MPLNKETETETDRKRYQNSPYARVCLYFYIHDNQ